jgi:hypothetical protein
VGLEIQSENQETVISVGEPIINKPPPKKKGKKILLQSEEHVCYDVTVMHYEFLPQGQTINQHYYNDTSHRLQENEWSGTT